MVLKKKLISIFRALIAVLGLVVLAWFSFNRNSLATLFTGGVLAVYFLAVLLQSIIRACKHMEFRAYLPALFIGFAGLGVTLGRMRKVDQDLRELNLERRQVLRELRPAFL